MHNESNNASALRQWIAGAEFRRNVALQVASGLIIAAIVAAIGFGFHQIRDTGTPTQATTQQQVTAPEPEPTEEPSTSSSAAQDMMIEKLTTLLIPAAGVLLTLALGMLIVMRGTSSRPAKPAAKTSLTKK